MSMGIRRVCAGVATLAVTVLLAGAPTAAFAQAQAKTERSNGKLVKYEKEAGTITVKEKGKDLVFHVTAEGSVLTRTTVTMNAKPAKLDDLKPGAPVVVYWKKNAQDATRRDARKIDMPKLPPELEENYGE